MGKLKKMTMMRMKTMKMRMMKMRMKKREKKKMEKTNYNYYESNLFSVKILRVLPPVILIIGIMIPEYDLICSLRNQHSDLVKAEFKQSSIDFYFCMLV